MPGRHLRGHWPQYMDMARSFDLTHDTAAVRPVQSQLLIYSPHVQHDNGSDEMGTRTLVMLASH